MLAVHLGYMIHVRRDIFEEVSGADVATGLNGR